MLLLTGRLSPSLPSSAKGRPYESGVSEPITTQTRWPVRFALVGMLFLIFDVEALFFYSWAVILRDLAGTMGSGAVLPVASFFVGLAVCYVYSRARGARCMTRCLSPSGSSPWATVPRAAASSTTTR